MALVFYEVVSDDYCDRKRGEEPTMGLWQTAPEVGNEVLMGSHDRWQVVHVEPYYSAKNEVIYLAMVAKGSVPLREAWSASQMRQLFPETSICIYASESQRIITCGWNMDGQARTGRLEDYTPTGASTLMKAEPTSWIIDRTEAYLPNSDSLYAAIHLCLCREDVLVMPTGISANAA